MTFTANFQNGVTATRKSDKPYTHAICCPSFVAHGYVTGCEFSFATSLAAAQKVAAQMGYVREFVGWSAGRRTYRKGVRAVTPEIVPVNM